jgi:hypothetical protein
MSFILNPLQHLRTVRRWADAQSVHMHLSPHSMSLTLTRGQRVKHLVPRFVVQREGRLCYIRSFEEEGNFAGWHQANPESWPLAQDKLAFKRQANAMGLRVPSAWNDDKPLADSFVLKNRTGSFGVEVHGPFKGAAFDFSQPLKPGSYLEQFISGRSAKAWCWNGQVAALELIEPPYLMGDGLRSLRELASSRGNVGRALAIEKSLTMLGFQGLTVEFVPVAGQRVLLDFKYASPFDALSFENKSVWLAQDEKVKHQFARAAALLHTCLPVTLQKRGLFTLDAVLDADGRAWFLEMNSHPMIHPDVYEPMLSCLMGAEA